MLIQGQLTVMVNIMTEGYQTWTGARGPVGHVTAVHSCPWCLHSELHSEDCGAAALREHSQCLMLTSRRAELEQPATHNQVFILVNVHVTCHR